MEHAQVHHEVEEQAREVAAQPVPQRRVFAVGGGKGGIGKSLVASNLAVLHAQAGRRVVLLDADLGGANLHTCLGIAPPKVTLSDFVERRVETLDEVVAPTSLCNIGLISGALDFLGAANPKYTQKLRLLREISRLDADSIIIDLGGGTGFNILDFFLVADHGVLTIVPEQTSVENAYRFIKAAFYRRLKTMDLAWNIRPIVDEALRRPGEHGLKTPRDMVDLVAARHQEGGERLRRELLALPFSLVVNQVREAGDERLGPNVCEATERYFGIPMPFLGNIPYDDAVWRSVRSRKPVVTLSPDSPASQALRGVSGALGVPCLA